MRHTFNFKTFWILILFLHLSFFPQAQTGVEFVNAKVNCHFLMLINATARGEATPSYTEFLKENIPADDPFWKSVEKFQQIEWFNKQIPIKGIPDGMEFRVPGIKDQLFKMAVQAREDYELFSYLTSSLLSPEEHDMLHEALAETKERFESLYWQKLSKLNDQRVKEFSRYENEIEAWVVKMARFYGNPRRGKSRVAIHSQLGKGWSTKSFAPYGQLAILGLSQSFNDIHGFTSVTLHEMAHELESSTPFKRALEIQSYYDKYGDSYEGAQARLVAAEAIPTALANAIAYQDLSGKAYDPKLLYNDLYIRTYAHALVPLCKTYLAEGKPMDDAFFKKSIAIFKQNIKGVRENKAAVMTEMDVLYSQSTGMDYGWIRYLLRGNFQEIYSLYSEASLDSIPTDNNRPDLIIIHDNQATNYAKVRNQVKGDFPKDLDFKKSYILYDKNTRAPTIILMIQNSDQLEEVVKALTDVDLSKGKGTVLWEK